MRVPILNGTRMTVARVSDETLVIGPPRVLDPIVDVAAAAAQAVRHPLSGPAARGARDARAAG